MGEVGENLLARCEKAGDGGRKLATVCHREFWRKEAKGRDLS